MSAASDPRFDDDPPPIRSIWDDEDDAEPARPETADATAPFSTEAAAWRRAEAELAVPLAAAAAGLARLDERLRAWPAEHRRAGLERLALAQAGALMWAEGAAIGIERLTLDTVYRLGRVEQAAHEFARAQWAARRLIAGHRVFGDAAALAEFQQRSIALESETPALDDWAAFSRARGSGWEAAADGWLGDVASLEGAHPVTVAAFAELAWRRRGLSEPGERLEAAVVAMTLAAAPGQRGPCRGGTAFAPLTRRRRVSAGAPQERLHAFYADLEDGTHEALLVLERLQAWRARAEAATADLSGRTPPRLIALLSARLALSARDAAKAAGVSVSAAARNLGELTARGLAREITHQSRYRFWTAAL
jgi:hypothetical protein